MKFLKLRYIMRSIMYFVSLKKITSKQKYHYLTCCIDVYPILNHIEGVVRRARLKRGTTSVKN